MNRIWIATVDGKTMIKVFDHEVDEKTVVTYYSNLHHVDKVKPVVSGDFRVDVKYAILEV